MRAHAFFDRFLRGLSGGVPHPHERGSGSAQLCAEPQHGAMGRQTGFGSCRPGCCRLIQDGQSETSDLASRLETLYDFWP